jgi:hypothetical protein
MEGQQVGTLELLLPLIVMTVPIAIVANLLAKEKGRNTVAWVVLALIPFINNWCILYFVGASNFRTEKKLDLIMSKLDISVSE